MNRLWSRGLVLVFLATAGCVSAPRLEAMLKVSGPPSTIHFGADTLAFANESRSKNPGKPDLYANWCFVMVRAVSQFQRFARFDASAPRATADEYTRRVRQITARAPWKASLPSDDRVVIPGYTSLYEFSRAQEAAVKAGLGGRFWTWIHWTNSRVAHPVTRGQQEGVARETVAELQAGRPVQWLVTNLPIFELNHTVLAYDYRAVGDDAIEFIVYDPNDPTAPGLIRFDRRARRFWSTRVYDTSVGPIRAFRMYYGPFF